MSETEATIMGVSVRTTPTTANGRIVQAQFEPEFAPLMTHCPTCGSDRLETRYPSIRVWICRGCRMMFRSPQPTDVDLNRFYSGAFTPENVDKHTTGMEGTTEALAKQYVAHVAARVPLQGKKVMEFGAGLGITCRALRDSGADVTAVEPFAWEECGKTGVTTYRSLEDLPESLKFDVILSLEVVEHLREPLAILRELRGRLLPSGWLYLATPNAASLRARLHRARWSEFAKYGHMLFYTPATLEMALRQAGFDECARVKNYIRYGNSRAKALAHYALHRTGLEGELRFLAQAN